MTIKSTGTPTRFFGGNGRTLNETPGEGLATSGCGCGCDCELEEIFSLMAVIGRACVTRS